MYIQQRYTMVISVYSLAKLHNEMGAEGGVRRELAGREGRQSSREEGGRRGGEGVFGRRGEKEGRSQVGLQIPHSE